MAEGKDIPGGSNVFFYFLAVLLGMLALVLAEWFYFSNRENWPAALIIAIIGIGLLIYPIIHYLILQDGNRPKTKREEMEQLRIWYLSLKKKHPAYACFVPLNAQIFK